MSDAIGLEKVMTFEEWIRQECFKAPPEHSVELAKSAWDYQQARIEALEAWKRRAMVLLNDATYHDGRYDQHTSREWQKEACALLREEE